MEPEERTIQLVADAIKEIVDEVVQLKGTFSHPMRDIPQPYPALNVLYDGFDGVEEEDSHESFVNDFKYELILAMPFDGRSAAKHWDEMLTLTWKLIKRFSFKGSLAGIARGVSLVSGNAVVSLNEKSQPVGMGHTFSLKVRIETEEE